MTTSQQWSLRVAVDDMCRRSPYATPEEQKSPARVSKEFEPIRPTAPVPRGGMTHARKPARRMGMEHFGARPRQPAVEGTPYQRLEGHSTSRNMRMCVF